MSTTSGHLFLNNINTLLHSVQMVYVFLRKSKKGKQVLTKLQVTVHHGRSYIFGNQKVYIYVDHVDGGR